MPSQDFNRKLAAILHADVKGYPGYVNAGISEIFGTWLIPTMFRQAASGKMSPEDAPRRATNHDTIYT